MTRLLILVAFVSFIASAQDADPPPKPSDVKSATPASSGKSRVDEVVEAVRAHVPDEEIIGSLRKDNKHIDLSLGDKTKLKNAGVSDAVIKAMQDPSGSATAPAPASQAAEPASDGLTLKADDSGPSLEATMKFIQDKLNGQGEVNWTEIMQVTFKSDNTQSNSATAETYHLSDAVADAAACALLVTETRKGEMQVHKWSFHDVDRLVVAPEDGTETLLDAGPGTATLVVIKYEPPPFKLRIVMNPGKTAHFSQTFMDDKGQVMKKNFDLKEDQLYFRDEEEAQRMAKAMVRAVELCGGGNKDPF